MSLPHPLTPVINATKDTISKADAPEFLAQLFALTPVTAANKTAAQLNRYIVTQNPDGSLVIDANWKS